MFIPPQHIVPELWATERDAVIRELLRHLIQVGAIRSEIEEDLFDAFRRREETMTTGVGFGCATPHITTREVVEPVFALGLSKSGVEFSSIDGRLVYTVVLMISPEFNQARM